VETEPLQGELFELNEIGLTIGLFADAAKSIDKLANYKTCSALVYVLASIYKSKAGLDDCLILNSRSNICESTNSNVFLVKDNTIHTPSLEEGCIRGVMRKQIILLGKKNGLAVNETSVEPEKLKQADEVFLTNAANGIRWVQRFGSVRYENKISHLLSSSLKKLLVS
jgi:branched-chain amino acid aminotransferase